MDFTGCGNTLHMLNPRVLQMIMDSLRYWVTEMHVDGFRFDLRAPWPGALHAVDKLGAFFDIIHQDPILSQVKLIAEPWDLGDGGYQVGNFPMGWSEWNGKYRDNVRPFLEGRRRGHRRFCDPAVRQQRFIRLEQPATARQRQLYRLSRWFHVAGSRFLQRKTQRGKRRGEPRRLQRQPELELRR